MTQAMSDDEHRLLAEVVLRRSGMRLGPEKRYLFEARLAPLLSRTGCRSFLELHARSREDSSLADAIASAMTTNETSFFRTTSVFRALEAQVFPELVARRGSDRLLIWSAACSTGQEAYSLAISLARLYGDLTKLGVHIRGSDLNRHVVDLANRAEYTQAEVERGLTPELVARYLEPSGTRFRIRDELRVACRFDVENLLAPEARGPFDLILCRNMLMYLAPEPRAQVVASLAARLKPHGFLIIGASESLLDVPTRLQRRETHGLAHYALG